MKMIKFFTVIFFIASLFVTSCKKDPVEPVLPGSDIHIKEDITKNTLWQAKYVYYIDEDINITNNATLTIEAGTIIKFANGAELNVSYSSDGTYNNIVAKGTELAPIIFTSQSKSPSPGDWDGIWLYEGCTASEFKYCVFEYAGGYGWDGGEGGITINYAKNVSIDYCTFRHNASYGFYIYQSPAALKSFTFNTFFNNAINDIKLGAYNINLLGAGNTYTKDIDVVGTNVDAPGEIVWKKQNTNYMINGEVRIGSEQGTTIIIEAGAMFKIKSGANLAVAYYDSGKIKALGTEEEPIIFTSADPNPSKGDWEGIIISDGSLNGSLFDYCNFSYGGGYSSSPAMIIFKYEQASTTTIRNCLFAHSAGYGVMLDHDPEEDLSRPVMSNNTFVDNTLGNVNW